MKNIFSRLPKKVTAAIVAVVAVAGIGGFVSAWSPERPTFTIENPADYVTFNSITNNPNYGDERTFFDAKDATNTAAGGFVNQVRVQENQELLLRVYVHNNAASSLNGSNFDGEGVARNTKVRIHLPTATDAALRANAYISADNATPQTVADTVDFVGANGANFALEYVPGSATAYTNAVPAGFALNDSIVTSGAPIGYTGANGIVPGCFEYTSIVTVKVKVKMPHYSVKKQVRFDGQTSADWKESVTANPGDVNEWKIEFENKGQTPLTNVKVVDDIPAGLTVVPGSIRLINGNYPTGYTYPASALQKNGRQINVDIGNYNPGIKGLVTFKTKVVSEDKLECGNNKIVNRGYATPTGFAAVSDDAQVQVARECVDEAIYRCDDLTINKVGGRKIQAGVKFTAENGATFKDVVYDFGDGSTPLVTTNVTNAEHTYAEDDEYTVRATVRFTVDGKTREATSSACAKTVSFTTPVPTTPTVLPNTGAGDVMGIMAATTVAGTLIHRFVSVRRFGRSL